MDRGAFFFLWLIGMMTHSITHSFTPSTIGLRRDERRRWVGKGHID